MVTTGCLFSWKESVNVAKLPIKSWKWNSKSYWTYRFLYLLDLEMQVTCSCTEGASLWLLEWQAHVIRQLIGLPRSVSQSVSQSVIQSVSQYWIINQLWCSSLNCLNASWWLSDSTLRMTSSDMAQRYFKCLSRNEKDDMGGGADNEYFSLFIMS